MQQRRSYCYERLECDVVPDPEVNAPWMDNLNDADEKSRGAILRKDKSAKDNGPMKQSYSRPTRRILDTNAQIVSRTVQSLIKAKKIRLPRKGFVVRMNRGKVIVERPEQN